MDRDIRIYEDLHQVIWRDKQNARMYPCDEWSSYRYYITQYDGPLSMSKVDGWVIKNVLPGKYTARNAYVLTRQMERSEWYEHMTRGEHSIYYGPQYVHEGDSYYLAMSVPFYEITKTWSDDSNESFKHYANSFAHSNKCKQIKSDIREYEGGTPVADVTFNEWKDADQGVITITAGRTQLQFTLMEAAQLLTAIPEAMRGYRDARVNAVQDQIKSLNEALAVLQQVPTQTNGGN
jgi:hypothetical protein